MHSLFKPCLPIAAILFSVKTFCQFQPAEPASGYGSAVYTYDSVIKFNADDGQTGFMLYVPTSPHADSLPLVIFNHGYGAWNPMSYAGWINHIVRRGNIVIFPRYQQDLVTSPTIFTTNAATAYARAIDTLAAHPEFSQPILSKLCIVGHSFGGVITGNMAGAYNTYGLPKPRAMMAADPGYGPVPIGALPTYTVMDSAIYMLPVFELDDAIVDSSFALILFDSTINVPYSHKNLIVHHPDSHGLPPITATHAEPCSVDSSYDNGDTGTVITLANLSPTDATDYYCYWKLFDALQDCALNGTGCSTAFGDTYEQKYMGTWSDGTPLVPLEVRPANAASGLNWVSPEADIKVFPNPVGGVINLSLTGSLGLRYTIVDVSGGKVAAGVMEQNNIGVSGLSAGTYILSVYSADNQILYRGKVVK